MWAVGCILYELVFRQRIFRDDWQVLQWASPGGEHEIVVGADSVPDERKCKFISKVIKELLQVDPTRRPRAKELYERFISWGSDNSAPQVSSDMQSLSNSDPDSELLDPSRLRPFPLTSIQVASSEPARTPAVEYDPRSMDQSSGIPTLVMNARRHDGSPGEFLPETHGGVVSNSAAAQLRAGFTSPPADHRPGPILRNVPAPAYPAQHLDQEIGSMETQIKYSKLLHPNNLGIALKYPSDNINVGDLCFWDEHGKAVRILNIFDNHKVCLLRAACDK
jgi:serine/threonine protein kinase